MTDEQSAAAPAVLTERRGSVLITLNRPEVRNAVNAALAEGLAGALEQLDGEDGVSVGVLTGAGGFFSAGMDLGAFVRGESAWFGDRGFAGITQRAARKPLIAAIEGFALAGGLEIALACDLIVAAQGARMGIPEAKRSLVAAGGALLRMPRRMPYHVVMELALTGDPQPAERATLEKIMALLEGEQFILGAGLSAEEVQQVAAHSFFTNKPITVATHEEMQNPEALLLKAFADAGYICFLTVGGKENRAWPIRKGMTAWDAAGSIHSDMQKGFIRAEIIGFEDFIAAGGETEAKRAGKQRLEVKQYVMQDYDLVNFRFNK